MKRIARTVVAAGCMAMLGGCQVLGLNPVAKASRSDSATSALAAASTGWTEAGRQHLQAQRSGLAIEAFNRAIATGEAPAAALNGLGIAYSRLGRADLAYRFFSQAARAEPYNPVFARNLVMLTNSPAFTLVQMQGATPGVAARPAPASAARQPGRLYREGNRQFTLVTQPETAAPARANCKGPCKAAMPQVAARNRVQPGAGPSRTVGVPADPAPIIRTPGDS